MSGARRAAGSLIVCCGSLFMTAACTTMVRPLGPPRARPAAEGPAPRTSNTAKAAREACAAELVSVEARIARLDRARMRIRETLAAAGFERTTAEAMGDGTGAPGLALDAARSAEALETLLVDQKPVYEQLTGQIDWIAGNWFDPALMRWTSRHIRALRSMTAEEFTSLKTETMALREMLPDLTASRVRRLELQQCAKTTAGVRPEAARPTPPEIVPLIACRQGAEAPVTCRETVVVRSEDTSARLGPLDSASMSGDELTALGPDSAAWIAFVRSAAGTGAGDERVYVDGMPAGMLATMSVPVSMIDRVTVNGDPFTAEHSSVGHIRVDIDLRAPDRRWHVSVSSPSFGAGGGSPLGSTARPTSRATSIGVGGPVPRLPVTFSVQATHRLDAVRPLFIAADGTAIPPHGTQVQTMSSSSAFLATGVLVTSRLVARTTVSAGGMRTDHAGIGGLNGPTTGQRLDSRNRSVQSTWKITDRDRFHRGGFSFREDRLDAVADSSERLTVIMGALVTGGDEIAAEARRSTAWALKHVVEAAGGKWKVGVEANRETVRDARTPNSQGRFQMSAANPTTGTWLVSTGTVNAAARATSAAVFAEHLSVHGSRTTTRTGVRLDWQDGAGVMVSPRIVATGGAGGFQVSGAAGLFVQPWTPDLFVTASERSGTSGSTFIVHDVSPGSFDGLDPAGGDRLRMLMAPTFERRRDLVARAGLQRRIGQWQTGIEHTWTHGTSLPGTVREREAGGVVDVLSSARELRRHQTHLRASMRRQTYAITAHYQHVWSFDDADRPLALPARQGDVSGEWARSGGVPRHAAGLTALVRLPFQIHLSLAAEARTGAPYTILTGRDADGLGTFTDRGGLARNAGTLPSFRRIALSASRTIRLPKATWLAFDVGVRADNLTAHRNVTSVGHVRDSPMFGVPLSATPGRSIRVWAALAR